MLNAFNNEDRGCIGVFFINKDLATNNRESNKFLIFGGNKCDYNPSFKEIYLFEDNLTDQRLNDFTELKIMLKKEDKF